MNLLIVILFTIKSPTTNYNISRHSYFNRIPHLWNASKSTSITLLIQLKTNLGFFCLIISLPILILSAGALPFQVQCSRCQSFPRPQNFNDMSTL